MVSSVRKMCIGGAHAHVMLHHLVLVEDAFCGPRRPECLSKQDLVAQHIGDWLHELQALGRMLSVAHSLAPAHDTV
jgi:hypothetical protein